MIKVIVPVLAILTGFLSSSHLVQAESDLYAALHSSASTLEDRVAARRAARQNADQGKTIDELLRARQNRGLQSSSSSQRVISSRPRRSTLQLLRRSSSSSSSSVRSADTSTLLNRREMRRLQRLDEKPLPLKAEVIEGVNMERAKMGLPALRPHMDLETSAQLHAQDMKNRDFFSHENPDGLRSSDRIKATGYGVVNAQECRCSYRVFLGENLAKGQTSVEQVVREWMESPSHREAMLSKDYNEIGVGIVGDIWVLNFGKVEINPVP